MYRHEIQPYMIGFKLGDDFGHVFEKLVIGCKL